MSSISLQYDPNNPAAVKMLDAILSAGLFTISPHASCPSLTMEMIDKEFDQIEADVARGALISSDSAHQQMCEFVEKYAKK